MVELSVTMIVSSELRIQLVLCSEFGASNPGSDTVLCSEFGARNPGSDTVLCSEFEASNPGSISRCDADTPCSEYFYQLIVNIVISNIFLHWIGVWCQRIISI